MLDASTLGEESLLWHLKCGYLARRHEMRSDYEFHYQWEWRSDLKTRLPGNRSEVPGEFGLLEVPLNRHMIRAISSKHAEAQP